MKVASKAKFRGLLMPSSCGGSFEVSDTVSKSEVDGPLIGDSNNFEEINVPNSESSRLSKNNFPPTFWTMMSQL